MHVRVVSDFYASDLEIRIQDLICKEISGEINSDCHVVDIKLTSCAYQDDKIIHTALIMFKEKDNE